MCGRFTLFTDLDVILKQFHVGSIAFDGYEKRYNIAPGQPVLAIVNDGRENRIGYLKWGLIPFWAKDPKMAYRLINARAETLAEKASFKHAFKKRRCIIPADGFYEWKKTAEQNQPYRIKLKSDAVFGFAGLWERWTDQSGQEIHTCTIITTQANSVLKDLHHRMPVILNHEEVHIWLDPSIDDPYLLADLLDPYPAHEMHVYPVSPAVNSAKNDRPDLIEPMSR